MGKKRMKQHSAELLGALDIIVDKYGEEFCYSADFIKRKVRELVAFNFYHNNQVGQLIRMSKYRRVEAGYNNVRTYNLYKE